jgi:hypothetical protein
MSHRASTFTTVRAHRHAWHLRGKVMTDLRKAVTVTVLAGVVALLGGCADLDGTTLTTGTVIDKEYDPSKRKCTGSGKKRSCHYTRECWELTIQDPQGNTGDVCVSFAEWRRVPVGSHYQGGGPSW